MLAVSTFITWSGSKFIKWHVIIYVAFLSAERGGIKEKNSCNLLGTQRALPNPSREKDFTTIEKLSDAAGRDPNLIDHQSQAHKGT